MSTESWFRNPDNYIRELVEVGVGSVVWDRGLLIKKSIDPDKHAALYFGRAIPWRALVVGTQGTAELDADHSMKNPKGVYPTWAYGEEIEILEELVRNPAGSDERACLDTSVPIDERPVWNQEHRVVITDLPLATTGQGRRFLRYLKELQEDFPDCILHVHGLYSWRLAFGMGYRSADVEPRSAAQKGKVHLPSGQEEKFERVQAHPKWVTVLGFKPVDLAVPRVRCMYNIKSALWAGENYEKLYKFSTKVTKDAPDYLSPDDAYEPRTDTRIKLSNKKGKEGDYFHCDTCSLQLDCKYQRDGAVCSVPGAEPVELAKYFKTRDSGMIIDGLGTLMAAQTRRLERGLAEEEDFGLDPEVTKMMNQLFEQGVKLAKLINPELRGGAKVQVNVGPGGAAAVSMGNPRQFIAGVIRELELQGIPREKITTKMIEGMMSGMANPGDTRRAIEGEVVAAEREAG